MIKIIQGGGRLMLVLVGILMSASVGAQTAGDIVENRVAFNTPSNKSVFAEVPLPPGKWEVLRTSVFPGKGYAAVEFRDVQLAQLDGNQLKSVLDITMKVNGINNVEYKWDLCKTTPILAKDDFGTSLYKQKCLSLRPVWFWQQDHKVSKELLALMATKSIQHDDKALMLEYERYGDMGYYLQVRQYLFPETYGMDNPAITEMKDSPWHPTRIDADPARRNFADALFKYGLSITPSYDKAYFRRESPPLPAFVAP
ncbi:hypothetical protein [Hydrogenophaga sp. BPS33]|uniref:hypothetical protein n=1 Tax=Hydrogenophaga sp. BPS33 TaxID=2651974 RepID=UPI00131FB19A|nr:hypothetical protein [Hydrogenophaga sp. BPS33]QHE86658.1 hypothetical protein F9K07_18010 [Hydrogenophaga sp. BPS33]